ncbi:ATPase [bacterium]|nr:ATPase [bacterium]
MGGRIHIDFTDVEVGDVESQDLEFRRARLFAKGNVANDWKYKAQVEFDADAEGGNDNQNDAEEVDLKDMYVTYTGWGNMANLTIGQQKESFSLENLTSSNDITLLSRSGTAGFTGADDRNLGVQLHGSDGTIHYGAGFFRTGTETNDQGKTKINWATTGRVAFSPMNEAGNVLHFGLGYTVRDNEGAGANSDAFNLEAAWVSGPFSLQGEYTDGDNEGGADADGFYLQGAWTITGESRPYKGGKFKRIKPANGPAWEVALRFQDGTVDTGLVEVDSDALTVGVNSYLNNNVKLGLEYTDGESESGPVSVDATALRFRTQLVF